MSEIGKLFEATKPFRDEITKLHTEVDRLKAKLKDTVEDRATISLQKDGTYDLLKAAELQISALRTKMGQIRNLLCAPGPGVETPTKKIDAAWRIAVASSGAVGTSEKHGSNDKRNPPHDHSDPSSPCDMLCMEESECICLGDGKVVPFCTVHGLPMSGH